MDDSTIEFAPKELIGIKIEMLEPNDKDNEFEDQSPVYGISEIKFKNPANELGLDVCDDNSELKGRNKWRIEDVKYFDKDIKTKFDQQQANFIQKQNWVTKSVQQLVHQPKILEKQRQYGYKKQEMLKKFIDVEEECGLQPSYIENQKTPIETQISGKFYGSKGFTQAGCNMALKVNEIYEKKMDPGIRLDKNYPVDHDFHQFQEEIFYNCQEIKDKYPYKKTGFYFLKNGCSDLVLRQLCDLQTFQDYILHSFDEKKSTFIKDSDDVQKYCGQLGLYPVHIKSRNQVDLIQAYLKSIKRFPQESEIIPLTYDQDIISSVFLLKSDFQALVKYKQYLKQFD